MSPGEQPHPHPDEQDLAQGPFTAEQLIGAGEMLDRGATFDDIATAWAEADRPPEHVDESKKIEGPLNAGRIQLAGKLLADKDPAEIHNQQLYVKPKHVELARQVMNEDLAAQASAHGRPAPAENSAASSEQVNYYLTPEQMIRGTKLLDIASRATTGPNGPYFLNAKFQDGWIPGVDQTIEDFQAIVPDGPNRFRKGGNANSFDDFLFGAYMAHQRSAKTDSAAWFLTHPSREHPGQHVGVYGTWQYPTSAKTPSGLSPVLFCFEIPEENVNEFMAEVDADPKALEAMLLASSFGDQTRTKNPNGPIVRNQSRELEIVQAPIPQVRKSYLRQEAPRVLQASRKRRLALPHPPIGDVYYT